jgi:hypothetical protein
LVERYKHARFRLYSEYSIFRTAPPASIRQIWDRVRGSHLIVSIASNDFERIEQQADLVGRSVNRALYLIGDNSSNPAIARYIEAKARRRDIPYVRLPPSPWSGRDFSRDHGFAMTWAWRHVVRPGRPTAFGFIDHDIYPLKPTDPFAPLSSYPVAGRIMERGPAGPREPTDPWYLWAGFCFFRFDAVHRLPLDFSPDLVAGFDTGFSNWHCLYRDLDRSRVPAPPFSLQPVLPDVPVERCAVERLGDWLHESRFRNLDLYEAKRRGIQQLLPPPLLAPETESADRPAIRDLAADEARRIVRRLAPGTRSAQAR